MSFVIRLIKVFIFVGEGKPELYYQNVKITVFAIDLAYRIMFMVGLFIFFLQFFLLFCANIFLGKWFQNHIIL